jgi:hypothetical protein
MSAFYDSAWLYMTSQPSVNEHTTKPRRTNAQGSIFSLLVALCDFDNGGREEYFH